MNSTDKTSSYIHTCRWGCKAQQIKYKHQNSSHCWWVLSPVKDLIACTVFFLHDLQDERIKNWLNLVWLRKLRATTGFLCFIVSFVNLSDKNNNLYMNHLLQVMLLASVYMTLLFCVFFKPNIKLNFLSCFNYVCCYIAVHSFADVFQYVSGCLLCKLVSFLFLHFFH